MFLDGEINIRNAIIEGFKENTCRYSKYSYVSWERQLLMWVKVDKFVRAGKIKSP